MEVLALVIDRGTSAEVSKINDEIGRSVYWGNQSRRFFRSMSERERLERDLEVATRDEKIALHRGDATYESLLREYVTLKLYLHNLRKTLYFPYDSYTEVGDYKKTLTRCDELKQQIRDKRRTISHAAWGGLEPAKKPTDYDKPILSSMEEGTCSFIIDDDSEDGGHSCPFNGEHWYLGKPYCRAHFHQTRTARRQRRRAESILERARHWQRHKEEQHRKTEAAEEKLQTLRPADPMEPCVVPGCWQLGKHEHENMTATELVELIEIASL